MDQTIASVEQRIAAQAELIPVMYGGVDFGALPERFTQSMAVPAGLPRSYDKKRAELLANDDRVALMRAYTMLGDNVADAYAALMPKHGFKRLTSMLSDACSHGLSHVPDAPPELVAFIHEMEPMPKWLDPTLIEEGARGQRNAFAHVAPYAIRGAFFATFMNKYSALPMALTGTLTNETAARRVKETATFFTTSVLPGALARHGEGFRSAAMVRLMHSMVRFNLLTRGRQRWDVATYGIPIPQVDQMPAGLIGVFLLSRKVLKEGRKTFSRHERASVELARYRCFLLGLPEDLLADTPQEIVDLLLTRAATLRGGFDEATCGALMRATMAAKLTGDDTPLGRLHAQLERSFAKLMFVRNFANNDRAEAARYGIEIEYLDYVLAAIAGAFIYSQMAAYSLAERIPLLRDVADERLVAKLIKLLEGWGHAEYASNAEAYRPVHTAPAAAQ
jgi:hypothetical protein